MSIQAQNAQNLYLHAIQDGRVVEAQASSVGDTYIQYSTGVPDGKEGFAAFFADFLNVIQNVTLRLFVPLKMEILFLFMFTNI